MRLIDADKLIDEIDDKFTLGEIGLRQRDDIVDALEYAETAHPKWIPCSERLPDTNYRPSKVPRVLVSWVDDNIGIYVSPVYCSAVESYYKNGQINAWMPLPEPYTETKGEQND